MVRTIYKLMTLTYYKLKMLQGDRLLFAVMVIIPAFTIAAMGSALRYEKLNTIPMAFVDEDGTDYSKALVLSMEQKEGFKILTAGRDDTGRLLENGDVEVVFIIKKGFLDKIISGENEGIIDLMKAPSSFSADYACEVVAGEIMKLSSANMAISWISEQYKSLGKDVTGSLINEIEEYVYSQWEPEPLMTVDYREINSNLSQETEKVSLSSATAASTGIVMFFMMFYILFNSSWLIEERRNGTLKRLIAGPGALVLSYAASIGALLVSGILQLTLFLVIIKVAFGVELLSGVYPYIIFFAYLMCIISISMLFSSILKTPAQLQAGAPVLALLTGFVGGCFWSFIEVPDRIRALSMLTPQGWALYGINMLSAGAEGFRAAMMAVEVLVAAALILTWLSYAIIKVQAET